MEKAKYEIYAGNALNQLAFKEVVENLKGTKEAMKGFQICKAHKYINHGTNKEELVKIINLSSHASI